MTDPFFTAIFFTCAAGFSTTLGAFAAFFIKKDNIKLLSFLLSFSAGVMLFVSYTTLLPQGKSVLLTEALSKNTPLVFFISFVLGMILASLIDRFVPEPEFHKHQTKEQNKVLKTGLFMAIILAIHNFPEGLSTFVSSLSDLKIGSSVALAMAVHNIPEGIAIAVPIYCLTGSRKKAFLFSFLSGIIEPIGAMVGYFLLLPVVEVGMSGGILIFAAGLMIYVSIITLLSFAKSTTDRKLMLQGLLSSILVMLLYSTFIQ